MPTVQREGGYRFYFYSHEPNEPPHVHADGAGGSAKVWLDPVAVARTAGLRARDITRVVILVRDNRAALLEAWHEFFGRDGGPSRG